MARTESSKTTAYRRRLGIPGRLRHAVADILSDKIGNYVDPMQVYPATGHWRTSPYADVYRWEVSLRFPECPSLSELFGCWATMTEFVKESKRDGFYVDKADGVIYLGKDPSDSTRS